MRIALPFTAALLGTFAATSPAQTPTLVNGQKVLLDKHGRIALSSAPVNLPGAPLVGGSDSCATPDPIFGTAQHAYDNTTATTGIEGQNEAICFSVGQTGIDLDVWFVWTAGFTGTAELMTCNFSGMDSKVAIYAGGACPLNGSALACNDDSCGLQTIVDWSATAGNTYLIQLGRYPDGTTTGSTGAFTINHIVPPMPAPNDDCSMPIVLPGPGTYAYDARQATTGTHGQTTGGCGTSTAFHKDVWYTYTANQGGTATITTCGLINPAGSTSFDTKIEVFAGAGCPTAAAIACNDDAPCSVQSGFSSTLSWPTVCGQTYTIQIGQFLAFAGILGSFSIAESGPACGPIGVPFCFGDGTGTACPCGNQGAPGNGCASSSNAVGANLRTAGNAIIGSDTLALIGTHMPDSSALYFQGTTQISVQFGDGLRCAGGTIRRLGTKTNAGGASQYPTGGDQPVSVRGAVTTAGSVRTYQVWYRNAATFCTADTFNLSNGMQITWQ